MADLISDAVDWLASTLKTDAGQTVVYWRASDSVSVTAVVGQSVAEAVEEDGRIIRVESRDFLIARADLVLSAVNVEPERGDVIRWTIGSTVYVYEVIALPGESHWRDSDPYLKTFRIHTKRVAIE